MRKRVESIMSVKERITIGISLIFIIICIIGCIYIFFVDTNIYGKILVISLSSFSIGGDIRRIYEALKGDINE